MQEGKRKGYLSITQLSRIKHITTETLRHYDRIGLFVPDYVDSFTRYRYYSLAQIEKIDTIIELRDMGMSLADIKNFMENRDVEFSYQILSQKQKELEKELHEKRILLKNIQKKLEYIEQMKAAEKKEVEAEWKVCYLKEEKYVVSETYQTRMEEYLLDVTKLKQNLKEQISIFATNYVGSVIKKESFLNETEKQFARKATLPAAKCKKRITGGALLVMPEGEYLCGKGNGYFRFGCKADKKIKQWLLENHYKIDGNIIEYDDIDLALTNKEEEIVFGFKIPVKKY